MALIYLDDYIDLNNYGDIVGVSYQVALDKDFKSIIYQDFMDKEHIHTKRLPIYIEFYNTPNEYILDGELFVRCKIYYKGGSDGAINESKWFMIEEDIKKRYISPVKFEGIIVGYTFYNPDKKDKDVMVLNEKIDT